MAFIVVKEGESVDELSRSLRDLGYAFTILAGQDRRSVFAVPDPALDDLTERGVRFADIGEAELPGVLTREGLAYYRHLRQARPEWLDFNHPAIARTLLGRSGTHRLHAKGCMTCPKVFRNKLSESIQPSSGSREIKLSLGEIDGLQRSHPTKMPPGHSHTQKANVVPCLRSEALGSYYHLKPFVSKQNRRFLVDHDRAQKTGIPLLLKRQHGTTTRPFQL
jgi:hypothetical protein